MLEAEQRFVADESVQGQRWPQGRRFPGRRPRRPSVFMLLSGLAGDYIPAANPLLSFRAFVESKKAEMRRLAAQFLPVGSPEAADRLAKLSEIRDEVQQKYFDVIMRQTNDPGVIEKAGLVWGDFSRLYFYLLGGLSSQARVKEKGGVEELLQTIKNMLAGAGGLATIALLAGGAYLIAKRRR